MSDTVVAFKEKLLYIESGEEMESVGKIVELQSNAILYRPYDAHTKLTIKTNPGSRKLMFCNERLQEILKDAHQVSADLLILHTNNGEWILAHTDRGYQEMPTELAQLLKEST